MNKRSGSRRLVIGLVSLAIAVLAVPASVQAEILTYQVAVEMGFPDDDVSFSGTLSYDTDAVDQLGQANAGRFDLTAWNLVVDINGTQTLTFVTGAASGTLTQGVNPTQFIFTDDSFNQLGFSIDFEALDPNLAPIIPDGTPILFSFIEGNVPPSVNDMELPVAGSPVMSLLQAQSVPTVSEWGLIVMAGFFVLTGAYLLNRFSG